MLGILGFTGATLSAAAAGSAAMLFGLGIDGVVLLYVAHRLAVDDRTPADGIVQAIAGPSSSMLLGMWTTAATFYGLTFVDFPSLQQLGLLIGHAMIICGILTLVLVPALLPRTLAAGSRRRLTMPALAAWIARRRALVLGAAALTTGVLGIAAAGLHVNPTLDRLRSVTGAARLEERLAPMFGLPQRGVRRARGERRPRGAAADQREAHGRDLERTAGRGPAVADAAAAVAGHAGTNGRPDPRRPDLARRGPGVARACR